MPTTINCRSIIGYVVNVSSGSTLLSQNQTSETWLEMDLHPNATYRITVMSMNNADIFSEPQPYNFTTPSKWAYWHVNTSWLNYKQGLFYRLLYCYANLYMYYILWKVGKTDAPLLQYLNIIRAYLQWRNPEGGGVAGEKMLF